MRSQRNLFGLLSIIWVLVCAAGLAGAILAGRPLLVSDMRELVPESRNAALGTALSALSESASRSVYILTTHKDKAERARLVDIVRDGLQDSPLVLKNSQALSPAAILRDYAQRSENFVTASDMAWLESASDKAIAQRALRRLARPGAGLLPFARDPLGLFENWILSHDEFSRFGLENGTLTVTAGGTIWNVLVLENTAGGASELRESDVRDRVGAIRERIHAVDGARVLSGGVSLIAEDAKTRARKEASIIGSVSLAGILILTWIFFRGLRVMAATLAVLLASMFCGAAAVVTLFGHIHLMTLVFGATLCGICADYVFHWFTFMKSAQSALQTQERLLKPLTVSCASTVLAFSLMALAPLESVRQMALFCSCGLVSAFLFTFGWLKSVRLPDKAVGLKPLCAGVGRIPTLSARGAAVLVVLAAALAALGLSRVHTKPELGLLVSTDPALMREQAQIARLAAPTTPGQFIVLKGTSGEALLAAGEKLDGRLKALQDRGVIGSFRSVFAWLPGHESQLTAYRAVRAANERAQRLVSKQLGEPISSPERNGFAPLKLEDLSPSFLNSVLQGTVVKNEADASLTSLTTFSDLAPEALPHLQKAAESIPGAQLLNLTSAISDELRNCKEEIQCVLAGILAVLAGYFMLLYRGLWWRLWLPCALTVVGAQSLVILLGAPWSLFAVLPLVLLVGLSVDYAVLAHSEGSSPWVWDSLILAGLSTIASFGLLAFSATPALSSFGLTVTIGIALAWNLTLLLRKK